jgi:arsenite methyltransferase
MTDVSTTLPPALSRALDLLIDPPSEPDVSNGYLDLLGTSVDGDDEVAKNAGAIQAVWASPIGSFLYDNAQALTRRFIAAWQLPIEWLDIPEGGVALDVGAGPGSITTSLAHAAGVDGLALRCRHLRTDAGARGARGRGSAGGVLAGGRATTSVA